MTGVRTNRLKLDLDDVLKSSFLTQINTNRLIAGMNLLGTVPLAPTIGGLGNTGSAFSDGQLVQWNQTQGRFVPATAHPIGAVIGPYSIGTTAGVVATVAHGFAAKPSYVRWVLICTVNDFSYVIGDEIEITQVENSNSVGTQDGIWPSFISDVNATDIILTRCAFGNNSSLLTFNISDGSLITTLTQTSWQAKGYIAL